MAAQATQAGRQTGAHLPPGEGSSLVASQAGSQASQAGRPVTSLSPKEGGSLVASPASQAGAHLPSREGSNSAITQAVPLFPAGESSSQAGNNLSTSQAGSQVTSSGR